MAETEEEIIIIEESDAARSDEEVKSTLLKNDNSQTKKKIIFIGIGVFIVILIIITLVLTLSSQKKPKKEFSLDAIEKKLQEKGSKHLALTKLDDMIAKANYLYTNGSKDKALFLYEKIAEYSESISHYNLGVAQLKNKQYAIALQSFQKAINNGEKRCVSAINAAVCSLHINDKINFKYYTDLAYAYLPHEVNSDLYSYYYTLIQYYKDNYLETLSALNNPTTDAYPKTQKHIKARVNALLDNNYDAIENLENNYDKKDSFALGLLYARVGDLNLAKQHLNEALQNNIEPVKSALALGFVQLKSGQVTAGGTLIQNTTDMFGEEVYKPYPIKVTLKKELFDPKEAQKNYREEMLSSKLIKYQKIFYFSPYKIFNPKYSIQEIKKGTTNIYLDSIDNAKVYLNKSASSSSVNKGIVQAIKLALQFKTRKANEKLLSLVKIQPKHSILHYNLALTYAQMGDMTHAYQHFLSSYHLDAKNYLSGIYAIMTAQLIKKDHKRLKADIKEYLTLENDSEDNDLLKTILYIADNNTISAVDWLNNNYKQKAFYLALEALIAIEIKNDAVAKKATTALTTLYPHDIVPHMIYIDAHFNHLEENEYAFSVINYLKKQKFSFNDLYYGPYITRYLYVRQNLNIGRLYFLRKQLSNVLGATTNYTQELNGALALACLYDKAFEESYVLYNHLIDDLKVRDAYTLFLGAVASTAAEHHANAIALLELSKMKNKTLKESRYALGLLYLEDTNNMGAAIQLKQVGDNGFTSDYFNFEIDTDKLYQRRIEKRASL